MKNSFFTSGRDPEINWLLRLCNPGSAPPVSGKFTSFTFSPEKTARANTGLGYILFKLGFFWWVSKLKAIAETLSSNSLISLALIADSKARERTWKPNNSETTEKVSMTPCLTQWNMQPFLYPLPPVPLPPGLRERVDRPEGERIRCPTYTTVTLTWAEFHEHHPTKHTLIDGQM